MRCRKRFWNVAARNAAFARRAWSSLPWRFSSGILTPPMPKFVKGWREIFAAAPATRKFSRPLCAPANRQVKKGRRADEGLHSRLRFARPWKPLRSARPAGKRAGSLATVRGRHRPDGAAGGRKTFSQAISERGEAGLLARNRIVLR